MHQEMFYNQSWFWAGFFTVLASIGGILAKEILSKKSQIKIEKIKLYESDIFRAYLKLYEFTSDAFTLLFPPNDPRSDFIFLMKKIYFKKYKKYKLYYEPRIREILDDLESQYYALIEPDLIPYKKFEKFYKEDLNNLLEEIQNLIEAKSDTIFQP